MESAPALQRYMAGDVIRIGLVLEHAANLARVFVAFSHEQDHLTELYFETTSLFETEEDPTGATGGAKRSRVLLEAPVPPEAVAGVYELTRVNVFSIGGKLARLREGGLAGISDARFEIVEEPAEIPTVARLEFLA
jgi:hypothetical protein